MASDAFPAGFVWGTATAAHQVEGGNWNNDWWAWEHTPGSPCQEPSGDACDHYHRYPRTSALLRRTGVRRVPLLARVEPHRARGGRVLACRARPLPAHVRRVPRARPRAGRHLPPLHDAALGGGARGGWTEPATRRSLRPLLRARHGAPGRSRRSAPARSTSRTSWRISATAGDCFRPASATPICAAAPTTSSSRRTARPSTPSSPGPARRPSASRSPCRTCRPSTAARRCATPSAATSRTCFLEAARGDDFVGVQTYTRLRFGPDGMRGPQPGVRDHADGLRVLARGARGDHPPRAGRSRDSVPIVVTENGIGDDDDRERIEYVERALHGVLGVPRRRDRRPRLLLLEPAGQLRVGVRLRPEVRPGRRRPDDAGAHREAERALAGRRGASQPAARVTRLRWCQPTPPAPEPTAASGR